MKKILLVLLSLLIIAGIIYGGYVGYNWYKWQESQITKLQSEKEQLKKDINDANSNAEYWNIRYFQELNKPPQKILS